jgi:hypothetical protein
MIKSIIFLILSSISLHLCFLHSLRHQLHQLQHPIPRYSSIYARKPRNVPYFDDIQQYLDNDNFTSLYPVNSSMIIPKGKDSSNTVLFPEIEQAGIDEKALRNSIFGKVLFGALEALFPVFKEPNWLAHALPSQLHLLAESMMLLLLLFVGMMSTIHRIVPRTT